MEDNNEVTYEYKTSPILAIIGFLLFFGMCYAGVHIATTNEKAIKLFGIVFSANFLNIFMWIFAAAAFYVGCKLVLAFIQALKGPRTITLTNNKIVAPANVTSSKTSTIAFNEITDLKLMKNSGKLFLHIHHNNGKVVIPSVALESEELFQDLIIKLKLATHAKG